jgi:acetylornithine/succinyldiaminopimelate/putrescine aminotransferase
MAFTCATTKSTSSVLISGVIVRNLLHFTTFGRYPESCAAGLAALKIPLPNS